MHINEFEAGFEALNTEDNSEWIDKVKCWIIPNNNYHIHIFQAVVEDEVDLKKYYNQISAAIATEFQASLTERIELWNIYLLFQCKQEITVAEKEKIEQDKYSTRKLVWDSMDELNIGNKDYIFERLIGIRMGQESLEEESALRVEDVSEKLNKVNPLLYRILQDSSINLEEKLAIYLGGDLDES